MLRRGALALASGPDRFAGQPLLLRPDESARGEVAAGLIATGPTSCCGGRLSSGSGAYWSSTCWHRWPTPTIRAAFVPPAAAFYRAFWQVADGLAEEGRIDRDLLERFVLPVYFRLWTRLARRSNGRET
jgi:hypothetical protein